MADPPTKRSPTGQLMFLGEDGLYRYAPQHLNHLNRLVLEHIGDDDYVRKLRAKVRLFREEHEQELRHATKHR